MAVNEELVRVSSFSSWGLMRYAGAPTTRLHPLKLARIGFWHPIDLWNWETAVACYRCRTVVANPQSDTDVLRSHCRMSPRCPVDKGGYDVLNWTPPVEGNASALAADHQGASRSLASTLGNIMGRGTGSFGVANMFSVERSNPDFYRLRSTAARSTTFRTWDTEILVIDPRDLAEAGFFYTGQGDRVQCAFCRGYLQRWIRGDRPADEHRRHFPDCPFVQANFCSRDYTADEKERVLNHTRDDSERMHLCRICCSDDFQYVLQPCGHVVCGSCKDRVEECPFCRDYYVGSMLIRFAQ